LWFKNGKVVKEKAFKGGEFLMVTLNTDEGARLLGELGIGTNKSAIHWDMLCDMSQGEIAADGKLIYKNGHFVE
jgi:aminopeptidase